MRTESPSGSPICILIHSSRLKLFWSIAANSGSHCTLSLRSKINSIFLAASFWGTCPGRFALQSATTTRKGQFHVREKQLKHSSSLARTMNELIKQIRKERNPPRKSASETRDPFRSRVINGARKRRIGAEKPLDSRYL